MSLTWNHNLLFCYNCFVKYNWHNSPFILIKIVFDKNCSTEIAYYLYQLHNYKKNLTTLIPTFLRATERSTAATEYLRWKPPKHSYCTSADIDRLRTWTIASDRVLRSGARACGSGSGIARTSLAGPVWKSGMSLHRTISVGDADVNDDGGRRSFYQLLRDRTIDPSPVRQLPRGCAAGALSPGDPRCVLNVTVHALYIIQEGVKEDVSNGRSQKNNVEMHRQILWNAKCGKIIGHRRFFILFLLDK